MLPFLSKEVNYETKSGAFLCTCFTDFLRSGCFFRLPEEYAPRCIGIIKNLGFCGS